MSRFRLHPLDLLGGATLAIYAASAVLKPICLLHMARELDFSLTGGGTMEVVRNAGVLSLIVASGFLAARWGKERCLAVSCVLLGLSLISLALAPNFALLLVGMALLGLGAGAIEGLVNPLIQELHPEDSGRYLNLVNGCWSVGVVVASLALGLLLAHGVTWRTLSAGLGGVAILIGLLFAAQSRAVRPQSRQSSGQALANLCGLGRQGHVQILALAKFLAGGAEGAFTFWSATFIVDQLQGSDWDAGLATACFAGGMMIGRFACVFIPQHRLRRTILLSTAVAIVVAAGVPLVSDLLSSFAILGAAGLALACLWPSIQSYAGDRIRGDHTMLFILLSCAGITGFGVFSWLLGIVGEHVGLRTSFQIIPAALAVLLIVLLVERRIRVPSNE
jgi:fucose permease